MFCIFSLFPAHGEPYQHPKLSESAINPRHPISVLSYLKRHAGRWWDHKVSLCPPNFFVLLIMTSFCHAVTFWWLLVICAVLILHYDSLPCEVKWSVISCEVNTDHDWLLNCFYIVVSFDLTHTFFCTLITSSAGFLCFLMLCVSFIWKIMLYKFHYM